MQSSGSRFGRVSEFVVVAAIATFVTLFLWGPVLLAGLVVICVAVIGSVVRDLWMELRGRRPGYVAGTVDLSDLDPDPEPMRTFRTPNAGRD